MASIPPAQPDPRTVADDDEDAIGQGVSSTDPAEGDDDEPGEQAGSPRG
ncbi:hypothetical protein [Sphingomonas bacterium]|nr:hypothetical protein [Sphingomonas bacterium]